MFEQTLDGSVEDPGERRGVQSDPKDKDQEGRERGYFAKLEILHSGMIRVVHAAVGHLLQHAHHVGGGEDNSGHGKDHQGFRVGEAAGENQKLADETVRAWKRQRGKREHSGKRREDGHGSSQAERLVQFARVEAFVDDAHDDEERARGDAMVDHDQEGAFNARLVQNENAESGEAHVSDARIGHQLFQITLRERGQPAIKDRRDRKPQDVGHEDVSPVGRDGQGKAQEAIGAHLEQDAGEEHASGGGRFDVRRWQPRVKGKHRHFDGEGNEEGEEDPALKGVRVGPSHHRGNAEAAHLQIERDDRDQQQDRSRHRVNEEFERRIDLPRPAPNANQQGHRDEHEFPENEEENEVQGAEDPDHGGFHDQQADHEFFHASLDVTPRGEHAERHDQGGQQDQQETDAINPQRVIDFQGWNPGAEFDELEVRLGDVETPVERQGVEGNGRGREQRPPTQQTVAAETSRHRRGEQRAEDQNAQHREGLGGAGWGHRIGW